MADSDSDYDSELEHRMPGEGTGLSPQELFDAKMKTLARSVIKSGQLKTRRRVGLRQRKRDKIFHKVIGEWSPNTVFIDNEKVIVQNLEVTSQRTEIMLSAIKHVLPQDDEPEFAITWTTREKEESTTRSPLRQREAEDGEFSFGFGADSDEEDEDESTVRYKDEVLVFRAASGEEARAWINSINKAIQVSQSTHLKSSFTQLREYNTAVDDDGQTLQRQRRLTNALRVGRKKKSRLNVQAEEIWARANKEAKALPRPMQTVGRTVGAVAAGLSITMVGGFAKSFFKALAAPSTLRRTAASKLQTIWIDAIAWLLPPQLFHLSGDVPKPINLRRSLSRRSSSSRRRSRRRSGRHGSSQADVTRIFLANSACQADVLFLMFVAKALEDTHGNVKAFLGLRERLELLGLGPLFELFGFVFLSRRSKDDRQAKDRKQIARHFRSLLADHAYEWSVIFPERGWPTRASIEAEREADPARPELRTLLLPDANELTATLETLEGQNVEIYDVTIAYEGYTDDLAENEKALNKNTVIPSYRNLLSGSAASDIHMNLVRFDPEDILDHEDGVAGWLDERWVRKDQKLKHFALYTAFPPENDEEPIARDAFSVEGDIVPMIGVWALNIAALIFVVIYLLL
ncbi:1-acyl-glycerol-3-phosphate acyltransferase, putative [Hondaea fermentalgiana]|uniref:1-acyl-glycerol-3-phosphate acyltransferase, putative n=1 Tax=Hondaea fermentalgiana TaxID=2315210 RepID=A0A2R5GR76_9STRA|nr:1-acyl-glycerol-3-phosphate acyltransferase, putative [Hondaea fermentalgiana]|eukprot:GBG31133.1 1-acyl-glycerol-3-phosphate acyltransferase, putative [Hondaea fermentalgiana]